jgi:hypothetical protein
MVIRIVTISAVFHSTKTFSDLKISIDDWQAVKRVEAAVCETVH